MAEYFNSKINLWETLENS